MKKNEWASRFGAKRKALDKAYCAAAEASCVNVAPASPIVAQVRSPWQAQLDALQDERRRELKLLTEKNIRTI
jgi:hypothetical protein